MSEEEKKGLEEEKSNLEEEKSGLEEVVEEVKELFSLDDLAKGAGLKDGFTFGVLAVRQAFGDVVADMFDVFEEHVDGYIRDVRDAVVDFVDGDVDDKEPKEKTVEV